MLWTAFLLGFLGSMHCVGMCGPIAFMLPVDRSNTYRKVMQITLYHVGRLLTYSILGLIFGWVGKGLYLFGFQQQLSIFIGLIMILFVLLPQPWLGKLTFVKPIYNIMPRVKNALGLSMKKRTADTFLTIGFLNGFLPCGLVYMALFAAIATGNVLSGIFYMAFFGLGTLPLMTSAIYLNHVLSVSVRSKIQRLIPVLVVVIAFLFIIRGLGLGIPYLSPVPLHEIVNAELSCP